MSALWVHLDPLDGPGRMVLPPDEARHVVARRLRVGDALVAFDGRGRKAAARVVGLARRAVEVEVDAPEVAAEPASGLVLASAVPKGERLSAMLGMLVQLGVEAWQPLVCEQSAVRRVDPEAARLRRLVVESCKVARRTRAMALRAPRSVASVLEAWAGGGSVAFGDREGAAESGTADGPRLFLVGPEAGFTAEERARLVEEGARPVRLAPFNLRIETAAVAAAARGVGGRALDGAGPSIVPDSHAD